MQTIANSRRSDPKLPVSPNFNVLRPSSATTRLIAEPFILDALINVTATQRQTGIACGTCPARLESMKLVTF
jgi:hypothetical protein